MIPPASDIELVKLVQEQKDSAALTELINRHSGMYNAIAQKYSGFSDKIQLSELKDDKAYNMYQWIIRYKEDKGMKLSTFIGEMTRYMCLDTLNAAPDKVEITETNEPITNENIAERTAADDSVTMAKARANRVSDPRFWEILKLRHFGDKTKTWRDIGRQIGMTGQGALNIYNRHIDKVKDYIT